MPFQFTVFDDHEQVVFASDSTTGLRAIIALHDTTRGPALGGCRMWTYESTETATRDALRLARGMTYKAAIADLPLGGGKSVILGDPRRDKAPELMAAMGRAIDRLAGRYVAAEDVGTSVEDMAEIARSTRHVVGLAPDRGGLGDPSPLTALGVFTGLRAALRHRSGSDDLRSVTVAVQGLGHVGWHLATLLAEAGARLIVADLDPVRVERAVETLDARACAPDAILAAECDVLAPCALGGVLNDASIPEIRAGLVAGAANNQLGEPRHAAVLADRDVLYVPDYVLNAGGLIHVAADYLDEGEDTVRERVLAIGDTVGQILARADREGATPAEAADRLAENRFRVGPQVPLAA